MGCLGRWHLTGMQQLLLVQGPSVSTSAAAAWLVHGCFKHDQAGQQLGNSLAAARCRHAAAACRQLRQAVLQPLLWQSAVGPAAATGVAQAAAQAPATATRNQAAMRTQWCCSSGSGSSWPDLQPAHKGLSGCGSRRHAQQKPASHQ